MNGEKVRINEQPNKYTISIQQRKSTPFLPDFLVVFRLAQMYVLSTSINSYQRQIEEGSEKEENKGEEIFNTWSA